MKIYFRDILLIRISWGANICVQRVFEKNIYFIMLFPPHLKFVLSNERLDFCELLNKILKGLTMGYVFTPFFDHIYQGADIFGHDCIRS